MIKRIQVQNFKSFKDVSATLGLRTVLVGPNMSGKSNFIELFRFLQRMSIPREPGIWGLPNAFVGRFSESTWKGGESNLIRISLEGERAHQADRPNTEWHYEIDIVGDVHGSVRAQQDRAG